MVNLRNLMSITPKWKDSDKLRTASSHTMKFSRQPAPSQVKIMTKTSPNSQSLILKREINRYLSLKPADAKEVKHDGYFSLRLQTADYNYGTKLSICGEFQ